ncbi:MAG: MBL fold metallo-hydrolase [Acidobacteria bacterium]|nr:MBL fold metallo-hydrolase [Acidobacteriota bacterium]
MTRKGFLVLVAITALAGCSRPTPEQQFVNDAAQAMGGAERIGAVKTLVIEGGGTQFNIGQDLVPGASGQTFTVTGYKRAVDVQGGRARTELTRQPNFTFFQGPAAQKQVAGLDGAIGYNVAPNGTATRVPDLAAADRRTEFLHHPLTAVRAALDPMARLANPRTEGAESLLDVTTASGQAFTLAIDSTTKLPSRVVTTADNTNLGDVAISTTFAGYQAAGGLQLPSDLTTKTDDFTTQQIKVSSQTVDGDTGDLAAPAAAASAPAVSGPPPVTVAEEVLAPGIWYLAGGSHNSVLVEFSDHLMLIETPLNDARALAVIAKARELVPGKPLTQLVNSHHHFDHSGGVRAAISEGLTVITHQGNAAFYEEMAKRPHTIVPDALAKNAKPLTVEGVADERTITDGKMTVNLYPVTTAHSQTMLVAYFPTQRILVEADVYTPGAAVFMYAADFMAQLKPRNLRIDRIAPLHGKVAPYAQFVKDASAPPPATN